MLVSPKCLSRILVGTCCAIVVGCASDNESDSEGNADGGAGENTPPLSSNWVIISGGDQGTPMISSTIDGDYQNGHGVECYVFNNGETFLDIHAQDGAVGVSPHLSLTYWQFSSYQKERDEDFDPPAPRSSTFELSATIGHGADRYTYNSPSDFRDYLSLNPSCHTTFSSTGAQITGTMTCENLQNAYRGSVADITVKFSCERRSEH